MVESFLVRIFNCYRPEAEGEPEVREGVFDERSSLKRRDMQREAKRMNLRKRHQPQPSELLAAPPTIRRISLEKRSRSLDFLVDAAPRNYRPDTSF